MIEITFSKKKITDVNQHIYVCLPTSFVEAISKALNGLGAESDAVVFEK